MSVLGAYWYWFAAGAALIGLEAVVPGVMLLWMGVGAVLVGALLSLLPDLPTGVQMVVFAIAGPWMLSTLVDFIRRTIESIPSMIG